MNNNYKIFGLIVSLMRGDNPPKISKNFSENVMQKISLAKEPSYLYKLRYLFTVIVEDSNNLLDIKHNNFLKIAASVFFAVITAYSLISFERSETNVVSVDIIEDTNDNSQLIKRVNDKPACVKAEKSTEKNNESCK